MRIATKLALALTATSAVVLAARGWGQLQKEERELRSVAQHELRMLGRALQAAVEPHHQTRDDISDILDAVELRTGGVHLFVFDEHGALESESSGAESIRALAEQARADLRDTGQPVFRFHGKDALENLAAAFKLRNRDGTRGGTLAVVKPLADLRLDLARTRDAVVTTLLSEIGAISAVGWILVLLYVRRPLVRVIDGMRSVRAGNLNARVAASHRDEVADVASEFNRMVADLEATRRELARETESRRALEAGLQRVDKLVTVGQLSAGLAHEIGSPLQILNGRARALLTRADATPEIKRNAEILVAQSERVTRIVEQLLRFARRRTLHLADVDLRRSAQAVLDLLDHEARRRGVTISFTCADDLPQLVADADQLQQIVLNLVANALKATPSGGSVRVSMKQDTFQLASGMPVRPSITLTVEDTGVGMEEDQVNRAFEPFFTNWADGHGTGLGLAVVRAIVTDHGGTVGIASRPGTGTRVTVQLPVDGATSQAAPEVA